MEAESDEDMTTYDWLDTDQGYPLDSAHALGWRLIDGLFFATCEEHDMQVHHKGQDPDTAAEDRREWISERRTELERTCTNKCRTRSGSKTYQPGTPHSSPLASLRAAQAQGMQPLSIYGQGQNP